MLFRSLRTQTREHHVGRLEIAMHDATTMGSCECARDLHCDLQRLLERQRSLLQPLLQRSEEHTSELQSRQYLVCRLLLEKKKRAQQTTDSEYPNHLTTHDSNDLVDHPKAESTHKPQANSTRLDQRRLRPTLRDLAQIPVM